MARDALVVTDMLNDFLQPEGSLFVGPMAQAIVPGIKEKMEEFRARKMPVIHIRDYHHPADAEFNMFPAHARGGTWGSEVIPELAPEPGDFIILKRRYSGFFATDLDITLRELDVEHVHLMGCMTNICVLYTAADARSLNYRVTVYRDLVASNNEEDHRYALKHMEQVLGCQVV